MFLDRISFEIPKVKQDLPKQKNKKEGKLQKLLKITQNCNKILYTAKQCYNLPLCKTKIF